MKRICPNPGIWHEVAERLSAYAKRHPCIPPSPPVPLILTGWSFSNDFEKMYRWQETIEWAEKNGCADLVNGIPENEFYFTDNPTTYTVGPFGGPMYRPWDYEFKTRPSPELIGKLMDMLKSRWQEIVGKELSEITHPLAFTGKKARHLLVFADSSKTPPWGGWSFLSSQVSERRKFTRLRTAINKAIAPHEVDHIDFTTT